MTTGGIGMTVGGIPANLVPDFSEIDFDDESALVPEVQFANGFFLFLILIFLAIRLWTRLAIVQSSLRVDDFLLIGATIVSIASMSVSFIAIRHGLGTHSWNMPIDRVIEDTVTLTIYFRVEAILYCFSITLAKLSVIVLYLRVLPVPWLKRILIVVGFTIVLNFLLNLFINIFQCRPINAGWDFRVTDRKCADIQAFFYFTTAFNVFTQCLMCIVPLPLVWRLGMERRKKIAISAVFGVGFISVIASAMKFIYISDIQQIDMPYVCATLLIWSLVEVNVIILCASVPSVKAFCIHICPCAFSASDSDIKGAIRFSNHDAQRPSRRNTKEKDEIPSVTTSEITSGGRVHTIYRETDLEMRMPASACCDNKAIFQLHIHEGSMNSPQRELIVIPPRSFAGSGSKRGPI